MNNAEETDSGEELELQSPEVTSSTLRRKHPRAIPFRSPVCQAYPNCRRTIREIPPNEDNRPKQISRPVPILTIPEAHAATRLRRHVKASAYEGSTRSALLSLLVIFTASAIALGYVYTSFPSLEPDERQHIRVPFNIDDAKQLGIVLSKYKDRYFSQVISGICVTYVFLQTFSIPGTIFLSILSGFLFPFFVALTVICFCSALGATLCYCLSQLVGRRLVFKYFPEQATKWAETVDRHRDHLLNYMLFLRITPFVPNWFINLTAPVIGVNLVPFALGTFLGVAPPSFIAIQAGQTLHKLTSSSDAWSWWSVLLLAVFSLISLVPVLLKNRLKHKFD